VAVGRRLLRVRKHKVGLPPHKPAGEPVAVGKVAAVVAAAAVAVRNTLRQQAQRTLRQ